MNSIPETIDGLPNLCGSEPIVKEIDALSGPFYLPESDIDFAKVKSTFAIALHMHQPLIPAGENRGDGAEIISNLKYMMDHQGEGDNHNASVFHWCYKRMGEFVPQLVSQGASPRVMLDYSGTLFYGLIQMGLYDVIEELRKITCNTQYRKHVEWLGTAWGHAVAPSTPIQDFRLHVEAWRHHFLALFGKDALARVRGFSPPEMALPNHPDVAYEFVKTLKENGYLWVLVQEHTVELPDGSSLRNRHLPHRLTVRNSKGESISMIALIKTQGSDTKLVAQMQPYFEAKGLSRINCNGHQIPTITTQIGDGENGGVMMNEFPREFLRVSPEYSHSETPAVNGTEYLEYLFSLGVEENDFEVIQPIKQARLYQEFKPESDKDKLTEIIEKIKKEDHTFHMEGGSWTSNISWVKGYDDLLSAMERASARFAESSVTKGKRDSTPYRKALFHLLTCETSCYRYWGEGVWTDYGRELARRAEEAVKTN